MEEGMKEYIRKKIANPIGDPVLKVKEMLRTTFGIGDTDDEIIRGIKSLKSMGFKTTEHELVALEMLLSDTTNDELLVSMVLWDANQPLEIPDGPHARAWLRQKGDWIRKVHEEDI